VCCVKQELQSGNTMLSMGHVITTSVGMCDIDIRPVCSRLGLCLAVLNRCLMVMVAIDQLLNLCRQYFRHTHVIRYSVL